jgi:hypothetical protein
MTRCSSRSRIQVDYQEVKWMPLEGLEIDSETEQTRNSFFFSHVTCRCPFRGLLVRPRPGTSFGNRLVLPPTVRFDVHSRNWVQPRRGRLVCLEPTLPRQSARLKLNLLFRCFCSVPSTSVLRYARSHQRIPPFYFKNTSGCLPGVDIASGAYHLTGPLIE